MFYHCINRIVERRFALGDEEKEKFRALMRMNERFSGCRVLSYCLMDNHVHLLVEVPPMPAVGINEKELLHRLGGIYNEAQVAWVAKELAEAAKSGNEHYRAEIFARYTYRMHDLSEFMKGLFLRFSSWFNRSHSRTGRLWEQRFKSVIVEDGLAAKTMAAYIDLNPARRDGERPGGLSIQQLWGSDWRREKRQRQDGARGVGASAAGAQGHASGCGTVERRCGAGIPGDSVSRRARGGEGEREPPWSDGKQGGSKRHHAGPGGSDGRRGRRSSCGQGLALPFEVFHGRRGDRQPGVCEQGVSRRARPLRAAAQGWREEDAWRSCRVVGETLEPA